MFVLNRRNTSLSVSVKWTLLCACAFNLFFMHYYIFLTCHLDAELDLAYYVDNIVGVCTDLFAIFIISYWMSCKNIKLTLTFSFIITWLWSFSNVMYSRFFFSYLTLSAVGQGGALADDLIIQCILDNFHLIDLYYPIVALLFFVLLTELPKQMMTSPIWKMSIGILCLFLFDLFIHFACCFANPQLRYVSCLTHRVYSNHFVSHLNYSNPKLAHFLRGEIRTIAAEVVRIMRGDVNLTTAQVAEIEEVASLAKASLSNFTKLPSSTNVIFILVESYMSFTSEMNVDGKEVTPFLNSLKRDSTIYYNGKMKKNVMLGSSSDGQFIYMTGILPLRSVITLAKARYAVMPGLPKSLEMKSRMIIPTVTSMWNQDEMCRQYGFNALYSRDDFSQGINSNLTDKQVFQLAIQKDKESTSPFFSVVLTLSMHQPYKEQIDPTFPVTDSSMTKDLANYLNICHYTDRQIERYFKYLKESGLYDNSLIVIAADHPVGNHNFGNVSNDIPLYIINSGVSPKNMWQGDCNQLDVYTTLLDLLGCKSDWYGLGHSLVSSDYKNSVSNRTWNVSEWIIMGDYFSKK